jgi:hypothetical protein
MPESRETGLFVGGDVEPPDNLGAIRVVEQVDPIFVDELPNIFVLSSAVALPEVVEVIHQASRFDRLRGLLIKQERDPRLVTTMLDRAGILSLRYTLVHHDPQVFQRILHAWHIGAEDRLVADATLQDGLLLVKSCALETIEVGIDELPALQGRSDDVRTSFDVADDGTHLHWPDLDVNLDLESIRTAVAQSFP